MAQIEDPKEKEKLRLQCMSSWAFLLFATGLFGIIPACLLMGTYYNAPPYGAAEIGTYAFFTFCMLCLVIGIAVTAYWCRRTDCCLKNVAAADEENGNVAVKRKEKKKKDKKDGEDNATSV